MSDNVSAEKYKKAKDMVFRLKHKLDKQSIEVQNLKAENQKLKRKLVILGKNIRRCAEIIELSDGYFLHVFEVNIIIDNAFPSTLAAISTSDSLDWSINIFVFIFQ